MLRPATLTFFPLLLSALATASCSSALRHQEALPEPIYAPTIALTESAIYTATSEIRALDWDGKTLWAATAGGVLRIASGRRTKWTRREGLPSHEAFGFERQSGALSVLFANSRARWDGARWQASDAPAWKSRAPHAVWKGRAVSASVEGLRVAGRTVPLPAATRGTHITALLPRGAVLLAAVYGDGLWAWDGKSWSLGPQVPPEAREVLALAGDGATLWLGTRRGGIYRAQRNTQQGAQWGAWKNMNAPGNGAEPWSHNVQFLAEFGGVLWASTLDDGLVARTGAGWRRAAPPELSSSAPRQMVPWRGRLFVRHGNGAVDAFDGARWTRNALEKLPRRGVYALACDDKRLLAGGWGGWAEWDGAQWTQNYSLRELQGVPILTLATQGEDVWIGTQSRGLALWKRQTGELRFYDERDGLSDDWISALLADGERVWAGTFAGGLHLLEGGRWHALSATAGQSITSIAPDGRGGAWAATRRGLFHTSGQEAEKVSAPWLDQEIQALHKAPGGLWIGTRSSLNFRLADAPRSTAAKYLKA
jgi:hypothetical protein